MDALQALDGLYQEVKDKLKAASGSQDLEQIRISYLGRKGKLTTMLRSVSELPPEVRPIFGKRANEVKREIDALLKARLSAAEEETQAGEFVDWSLPGRRPPLARPHPLMQVIEEVTDIFRGMGFEVAEGPDIETDFYNFDALNTPDDHPARDLSDTFYIDDGILLRTHTSPVQIRVMENQEPPIRIIAPGRCFRRDKPDQTHSPNFFQVEGLYVDEGVTFGDLKGVIYAFAREFLGKDMKVRFRPHFFPFTEPSAEYDFSCFICGGKGCSVCKGTGWVEISGAGMVDPEVLKTVNIDSEKYTGYAFGMGLDRITMLRYRIDDIRLLFDNYLGFLRQF